MVQVVTSLGSVSMRFTPPQACGPQCVTYTYSFPPTLHLFLFCLSSPSIPPSLSQVTLQLSVCGLAEFIFHLTGLNPDMFQIAYNIGRLSQTFFNFDINVQGVCMYCTFYASLGYCYA